MINKRDLVLNQAKEILLNRLKDHIDNEFCSYIYFELTLGAGIEEYRINRIKDEMLTLDGTFKAKAYKKNGEHVYYSMNDLLNRLVYFLSVSLRERALKDRAKEIVKKYGNTNYLWGIRYYLKATILGMELNYINRHRDAIEKMIEEYILS